MKLTFNQVHHTLYVPRCWWHWLLNSSVTTLVKMYTSLKYKFFCWTLLFVIVSSDLVVYLHTNLCLICRHWAERRVVEGKDKDSHGCTWICICFSKIWIFYVFLGTGFLIRFFSGSGSVPVFGVDRFNDRFGSGNIDSKCQTSGFVHHSSSCFLQQ